MTNHACLGFVLVTALGGLTSCAHLPMEDSQPLTVLFQERTTVVEDAVVDGDRLWVPVESLPRVNGFRLESVGLCAGNICIPLAEHADWTRQTGGRTYVDVTAVAQHVHQVWVTDAEGEVWSFAPVPDLTGTIRRLGLAPDFTLPDMDGRPVRLTDYHGKKVLLLTWASW